MMHLLGRIACFISALAAICIGLSAFGVDVSVYLPKSDQAMMIMKYIVGASGLISMIVMLMHSMHGHCCNGCGKNPCVCKLGTHHRP